MLLLFLLLLLLVDLSSLVESAQIGEGRDDCVRYIPRPYSHSYGTTKPRPAATFHLSQFVLSDKQQRRTQLPHITPPLIHRSIDLIDGASCHHAARQKEASSRLTKTRAGVHEGSRGRR